MNYFKGRQFQQDVIMVAVGYYLRYAVSYRDLVEMMHDRGVSVSHTTIMRWVHHYGPIFRLLLRKKRHSASQSWRMDETYILSKANGIINIVLLITMA
jgi:putative transposase